MKRQTTLSRVLIISVLLSLGCVALANGQTRRRPVADTGLVALAEGEVLRITVNGLGGDDNITVGFRRIGYAPQGTCSDGVCAYVVAGQSAFGPITLAPGEAASIDIPRSFAGGIFVGVRGVVSSSSRAVRVSAFIIEAATGKIIASLDVPPLDINLLG